jgi:hypothetical protein
MASFTNASGPNSVVALLDMLVLTRLKRAALQEYWIPTLLHEEGEPLLRAFRRGEDQVWLAGAKVLSEPQLAELRKVIEQWQTDNPTQYYVSHVRFTDFANAMRITSSSPQVKLPSSVFGLLYVDPLAGLDPVAKELAEYRALSERLLYVVNRMPIMLSWMMERAGEHVTGAPQLVRFVDSTTDSPKQRPAFPTRSPGCPRISRASVRRRSSNSTLPRAGSSRARSTSLTQPPPGR